MGQGVSKDGRALCDAVEREDAETVQRIVSNCPRAVLYKTLWKRKTPLMLACQNGNVLSASTLLWASEQVLGPRYTSYINDASAKGDTALILACKNGHVTVTRILLEEGASPLIANRRGQTAAHVAAHLGHVTCLELVLDCPVRTLGGSAPLAAMAQVHDHAGETRFIDAHDRTGFAALHLAAISHSSAAAAALVQRGATLDIPILRGIERLPFLCGGSTPLHIAAAQGDTRTCVVLLDGQWRHPGLELRRVRNMLGMTPLNCALLGGHHEIVRILVESGRRGGTSRGGGRGRDMPRMIPLSAAFPESLRSHMLAVLQRAALLLQLRQIAGGWREAGADRESDATVSSLPGLDALSLPQITRLQKLLKRQDTSLRDVLYGLECTLHNRHGAGGVGIGPSRRNRRLGATRTEGSSDESEGAASTDAQASSSSTGDGARSTAGVTASEGASEAAPLENHSRPESSTSVHENAGNVDWTLLGRDTEAQYYNPHGLRSGSFTRRARSRSHSRSRRHGTAAMQRSASAAAMAAVLLEEAANEAQEAEARAAAENGEVAAVNEVFHTPRAHIANGVPGSPPRRPSTVSTVPRTPHSDEEYYSGEEDPAGEASEQPTKRKPSAAPATARAAAAVQSEIAPAPSVGLDDCAICMDSTSEVAFQPCSHSLCFHCACRLCVRGSDATTCPFCRSEVQTVTALAGARANLKKSKAKASEAASPCPPQAPPPPVKKPPLQAQDVAPLSSPTVLSS